MAKKWLMACKESNGQIYVTRLPHAIPAVGLGGHPQPGVPAIWVRVGPGLRPSIQHYVQGGTNWFILTFEYLSHLVCRVIPNIDETNGGTWPPTVVDPVTFNPTSIELPEDALAVPRASTNTSPQEIGYFFNAVQLDTTQELQFNGLTHTWSILLQPNSSWFPAITTGVTPYYRLYRRPITGGSWTRIMDWNTSLLFTDTQVGGTFRWQYTATWGALFNPANPQNVNDHAEGTVGSGTILVADSATPPIDFVFPLDAILVAPDDDVQVMSAYIYGEARQQFYVVVGDDVIQLSKARLEDSTFATPAIPLSSFVTFVAEAGSDSIKVGTGASSTLVSRVNTNAAPAGMFT